jgi:DNA polymerase III sliding clamp (beta) subunit (PCNA family)
MRARFQSDLVRDRLRAIRAIAREVVLERRIVFVEARDSKLSFSTRSGIAVGEVRFDADDTKIVIEEEGAVALDANEFLSSVDRAAGEVIEIASGPDRDYIRFAATEYVFPKVAYSDHDRASVSSLESSVVRFAFELEGIFARTVFASKASPRSNSRFVLYRSGEEGLVVFSTDEKRYAIVRSRVDSNAESKVLAYLDYDSAGLAYSFLGATDERVEIGVDTNGWLALVGETFAVSLATLSVPNNGHRFLDFDRKFRDRVRRAATIPYESFARAYRSIEPVVSKEWRTIGFEFGESSVTLSATSDLGVAAKSRVDFESVVPANLRSAIYLDSKYVGDFLAAVRSVVSAEALESTKIVFEREEDSKGIVFFGIESDDWRYGFMPISRD